MYTLEEARKIVLRELCASERGHDLEQHVASNLAGTTIWVEIRCARCKTIFEEKK